MVVDATLLADQYIALIYEGQDRPATFKEVTDHVFSQLPGVNATRFMLEMSEIYRDRDYMLAFTPEEKALIIIEHATSLVEGGHWDVLANRENNAIDQETLDALKMHAEWIIQERKERKPMRGFLFHGEVKHEGPKICPRCRGWIPTNENPGAYPGAMSRYLIPDEDGEFSRLIEICSACGQDEAFMQMHEQGRIIPPHEWPIERTYASDADIARQKAAFEALREFKESDEGKAAMENWDVTDEDIR